MLGQHVARIVAGRAVNAQSDPNAGSTPGVDRRGAAGQAHVAAGAWATPVPVRANNAISPAAMCTQCVCQTLSLVQPKDFIVLHRLLTECLQAELLFIEGLRKVGMQSHATATARFRHFVAAGQGRAPADQIGCDTERRARRQRHADHAIALALVECLHRTLAVLENCSFILDHAVGWQSALALAVGSSSPAVAWKRIPISCVAQSRR